MAECNNLSRKIQLVDSNGVPIDDDPVTHSQCFIPPEHCKIHDGYHFFGQDYNDNIDSATPAKWLVKTPNDSIGRHFLFNVRLDAGALVELFEVPTSSADGTGITVFNNKRNSVNTSLLTFFKNPTTSADGTRLSANIVGAGKDMGGLLEREEEIILLANTKYLIKVTTFTNDVRATVCISFYEVI